MTEQELERARGQDWERQIQVQYVPVKGAAFTPSKQPGLEEKPIVSIIVHCSYTDALRAMSAGHSVGEAFVKKMLATLESAASVAVDRWLETLETSSDGLTWYLIEPTMTSAAEQRRDYSAHRIELHGHVRAVRGLMKVNGHLFRSLDARAYSILDQGRYGGRR